jgi:hypothetical protein
MALDEAKGLLTMLPDRCAEGVQTVLSERPRISVLVPNLLRTPDVQLS